MSEPDSDFAPARQALSEDCNVLILTDSWDATTDLVIGRLGSTAFRLNTDLVRDYVIELSEDGFTIENPAGLKITSHDIRSVYWRKPFTADAYTNSQHAERFFYAECRYLVRELYNVAVRGGAWSLIEPGAENRLGKICQLSIARRHFAVPAWRVLLGRDHAAPDQTVVKSLSGTELDNDHVLYTTRVDQSTLDASHAWLVQTHIEKTSDVTVVFVNGAVFAFELDAMPGVIDWRQRLHELDAQNWRHIMLSPSIGSKIHRFMDDCALKFGRLDFAKAGDDLYFLKVNPNGQWAWLDLKDRVGLMTAMLKAIRCPAAG